MKITALDSFAHGAQMYTKGDDVPVSKDTAEELRKAGLVEFVTDEDAPQTGVTDSQDTDDLLGDGAKAEPAPQNKMEKAPANKGKK